MIPLVIYLGIILVLGSYIGIFRHHADLDEDFHYDRLNHVSVINEVEKQDYRSDISIMVFGLILVITIICSCFTEVIGASVCGFLLMQGFVYCLGYSITRRLLKSKKDYPGILSFNQNPLTFRWKIKGYTIIDWLAF